MNLRDQIMVSKNNYINPCNTLSYIGIKIINYVKTTIIVDTLAKGLVKYK